MVGHSIVETDFDGQKLASIQNASFAWLTQLSILLNLQLYPATHTAETSISREANLHVHSLCISLTYNECSSSRKT